MIAHALSNGLAQRLSKSYSRRGDALWLAVRRTTLYRDALSNATHSCEDEIARRPDRHPSCASRLEGRGCLHPRGAVHSYEHRDDGNLCVSPWGGDRGPASVRIAPMFSTYSVHDFFHAQPRPSPSRPSLPTCSVSLYAQSHCEQDTDRGCFHLAPNCVTASCCAGARIYSAGGCCAKRSANSEYFSLANASRKPLRYRPTIVFR